MKLKLHHVNVCSDQLEALNRFYEDVLGLPEDDSSAVPQRELDQGFNADVYFKREHRLDEPTQFHLTQKDEGLGERVGQKINPVAKGHIAFRTDDIDAFKRHLESKGVEYSDYGSIATAEWHQIFFCDPDGNVIEVHQVIGDS
jgi:catechol 2,3-dioxygenase-like lactoylglutathione lyase family enzyme